MTTNTRPMCPRSKVLIRSYPYNAALTDVFPILDRIQTVGIQKILTEAQASLTYSDTWTKSKMSGLRPLQSRPNLLYANICNLGLPLVRDG